MHGVDKPTGCAAELREEAAGSYRRRDQERRAAAPNAHKGWAAIGVDRRRYPGFRHGVDPCGFAGGFP